jgi:hypothetical protein
MTLASLDKGFNLYLGRNSGYVRKPTDPVHGGLSEQSPNDTAIMIANSAEYASKGFSTQDLVNQTYQYALDRTADPGGLQDWSKAIDNGTLSKADFINSIYQSDEYYGRVVDGKAQPIGGTYFTGEWNNAPISIANRIGNVVIVGTPHADVNLGPDGRAISVTDYRTKTPLPVEFYNDGGPLAKVIDGTGYNVEVNDGLGNDAITINAINKATVRGSKGSNNITAKAREVDVELGPDPSTADLTIVGNKGISYVNGRKANTSNVKLNFLGADNLVRVGGGGTFNLEGAGWRKSRRDLANEVTYTQDGTNNQVRFESPTGEPKVNATLAQ